MQKYLTPNPFIFLPFNAGPRICLGQQVRSVLPLFSSPLSTLRPTNASTDLSSFTSASTCARVQFAYNEASFMLVRLAQQFASIDFTPEVAPASVPPPGYADSPGSDGTDRVWMGSHLTMYAKVCVHLLR